MDECQIILNFLKFSFIVGKNKVSNNYFNKYIKFIYRYNGNIIVSSIFKHPFFKDLSFGPLRLLNSYEQNDIIFILAYLLF